MPYSRVKTFDSELKFNPSILGTKVNQVGNRWRETRLLTVALVHATQELSYTYRARQNFGP